MQCFPHPDFEDYKTNVSPRKKASRFAADLNGRFYANNGLGQSGHRENLEAQRKQKYERRQRSIEGQMQRDLKRVAKLERKVRQQQHEDMWRQLVWTSTFILQTWWRGRAARIRANAIRSNNVLAIVLKAVQPWLTQIRQRRAACRIQSRYRQHIASMQARHNLAVLFIVLRMQTRFRARKRRQLLALSNAALKCADAAVPNMFAHAVFQVRRAASLLPRGAVTVQRWYRKRKEERRKYQKKKEQRLRQMRGTNNSKSRYGGRPGRGGRRIGRESIIVANRGHGNTGTTKTLTSGSCLSKDASMGSIGSSPLEEGVPLLPQRPDLSSLKRSNPSPRAQCVADMGSLSIVKTAEGNSVASGTNADTAPAEDDARVQEAAAAKTKAEQEAAVAAKAEADEARSRAEEEEAAVRLKAEEEAAAAKAKAEEEAAVRLKAEVEAAAAKAKAEEEAAAAKAKAEAEAKLKAEKEAAAVKAKAEAEAKLKAEEEAAGAEAKAEEEARRLMAEAEVAAAKAKARLKAEQEAAAAAKVNAAEEGARATNAAEEASLNSAGLEEEALHALFASERLESYFEVFLDKGINNVAAFRDKMYHQNEAELVALGVEKRGDVKRFTKLSMRLSHGDDDSVSLRSQESSVAKRIEPIDEHQTEGKNAKSPERAVPPKLDAEDSQQLDPVNAGRAELQIQLQEHDIEEIAEPLFARGIESIAILRFDKKYMQDDFMDEIGLRKGKRKKYLNLISGSESIITGNDGDGNTSVSSKGSTGSVSSLATAWTVGRAAGKFKQNVKRAADAKEALRVHLNQAGFLQYFEPLLAKGITSVEALQAESHLFDDSELISMGLKQKGQRKRFSQLFEEEGGDGSKAANFGESGASGVAVAGSS